jgi:hypothetical protein
MRRHAALPRSRRSLGLDQEMFGEAGIFTLFLVEPRNRAVAGGVVHAFGQTVEVLYNASRREVLEL